MNTQDATIILADACRGIYAASFAIQNYGASIKCDTDTFAAIAAGPDGEPIRDNHGYEYTYAEACSDLATDGTIHVDGLEYSLCWEDGDLLAVHPDAQWSDYLGQYYVVEQDDYESAIPERWLYLFAYGEACDMDAREQACADAWYADIQRAAGEHMHLVIDQVSEPYFEHAPPISTNFCRFFLHIIGGGVGDNVVDVVVTPVAP